MNSQKNTSDATKSCSAEGIAHKSNVMAKNCPSRKVLQHLSSRWGGLIIVALLSETMRFSDLRRQIEGISEKMLAQTLQLLEIDGMVNRYSYDVIPPHVEYSLTKFGVRLGNKLQEIFSLIEINQDNILNKKIEEEI